nr:hemerythrin domain-containing protein [Pseudomonadota bacterium]
MLFITQLRHEHEVLLTLADELESVCSGARPDNMTPLLVLLERFNQLLQIHLLREDSVLYPAIINGSDP